VEIGNKEFDLEHVEEAYTTEHWLVRIYRVKDLVNREKSVNVSKKPIKKISSKKTTRRKKGSIKFKPKIIKGKKPAGSTKTKKKSKA